MKLDDLINSDPTYVSISVNFHEIIALGSEQEVEEQEEEEEEEEIRAIPISIFR